MDTVYGSGTYVMHCTFLFLPFLHCTYQWKKHSERRKHCTRAGCSKVRTPPARLLSQTHR